MLDLRRWAGHCPRPHTPQRNYSAKKYVLQTLYFWYITQSHETNNVNFSIKWSTHLWTGRGVMVIHLTAWTFSQCGSISCSTWRSTETWGMFIYAWYFCQQNCCVYDLKMIVGILFLVFSVMPSEGICFCLFVSFDSEHQTFVLFFCYDSSQNGDDCLSQPQKLSGVTLLWLWIRCFDCDYGEVAHFAVSMTMHCFL